MKIMVFYSTLINKRVIEFYVMYLSQIKLPSSGFSVVVGAGVGVVTTKNKNSYI